jgi:cytochrome c oxidase assembly factor CtaG
MGEVLFSAHMAQHTLLILVAAPLLVLGRPLVAFVWGLPTRWRGGVGSVVRTPAVRASWRWLTAPLVAWFLHGIAVWAWHAPSLYSATLTSDWMHALQHTSFLATALLFWWIPVEARRRPRAAGTSLVYLFATAMHTGVLGALLTFAPTLWYPAYAATTMAWGVTPVEDQQIAGLVMWIPGGVVYLAAALVSFAPLLRAATVGQEAR